MPSTQGVPDEPCTRRYIVPAFRRAVVDLWGEAGREQTVRNLSGDAREEFMQDVVGANRVWFPTRHVIAWAFAIWEGPANRTREEMARFIRRQWDLGAGVIRRVILHMAAPTSVVPRLGALWKQDNTAGDLTAVMDEGGKSTTIHLADSPFVDTPHGRASVAEIYRHAFAQTRAKNVTETHALEAPKRMVIRIKWSM